MAYAVKNCPRKTRKARKKMSDRKKERPILFGDEMVRAILDGRKTQTRRPVTVWWNGRQKPPQEPHFEDLDGELLCFDEYGDSYKAIDFLCSPFGKPGDRLWVREAHRFEQIEQGLQIYYRADDSHEDRMLSYLHFHSIYEEIGNSLDRNRPNIHMPRWASRITLEVVDVRVERLREISIDNIIAEGLVSKYHTEGLDLRDQYEAMWDSIYKKKNFRWSENPWVWICYFRVIDDTKGESQC